VGERHCALGFVNALAQGPPLVVLAAGRARRYGGCKPLAPIGIGGEAVIDLLASDAFAAGFSRIVLVIGSQTGSAIRYHVKHTWPTSLDVQFALQESPRGTVDAVLAACAHLDDGVGFGVCNADDLYGQEALTLLAGHVGTKRSTNTLVGFRLEKVVIGDAPVTRGICEVDAEGQLTALHERRQVFALGDGHFVVKDGVEPGELPHDALVSMNLWGFMGSMKGVFAQAMARATHATEDAEVLLPELVGQLITGAVPDASDEQRRFSVVPTESRCIGVTHPDDLALVQADIAHQIATGERPGSLWGSGVEKGS
jgi:hypothetical protein